MPAKELIEAAYRDLELLGDAEEAVTDSIARLDAGELRVAEKVGDDWVVHTWLQEAIFLYFRIAGMETLEAGALEFHDKIPPKRGLAAAGVRVVPPGVIRYGAFCEPGVVVMPGYVNIGARVGSGTLVDTWATVGSCAQVGSDVHISGGVGIGGVLEPPGSRPNIVEDGAFLGSRCILLEGVVVEEGAVLAANTAITASTPIIDVTGDEPVEHRGRVPANSVVVPGARAREFPAGSYYLQTPLIIGKRSESTDRKTSLNDALRDFGVPV
ncbi:MAG: 2,3,4,5-tetrahydropyridine-2,6-dicarboxylate N-succinyltransferase [Acidimicrobiia bacterium]